MTGVGDSRTDVVDGLLSLDGTIQSIATDAANNTLNWDGRIDAVVTNGLISGAGLEQLRLAQPPTESIIAIRSMVEQAFKSGQTRFKEARGSWGIFGSEARTDDTELSFEGGGIVTSGHLDLSQGQVSLRNEIRLDAFPDAPPIIVNLNGIGHQLTPEIRADGFSRHLARQARASKRSAAQETSR